MGTKDKRCFTYVTVPLRLEPPASKLLFPALEGPVYSRERSAYGKGNEDENHAADSAHVSVQRG